MVGQPDKGDEEFGGILTAGMGEGSNHGIREDTWQRNSCHPEPEWLDPDKETRKQAWDANTKASP